MFWWCSFVPLFRLTLYMDSVVLKDSIALFPESIASVVRAPPNTVKIVLKPGNRSTWESHKCSGTQWEQFINTETNLLAWNTMRAVEELSLCPGIVEGAQNAAITEELYRRSPRRQKKRKKKLQVQPCIGWSSNYWSYGLGKKCYRVLEYYRVHIYSQTE